MACDIHGWLEVKVEGKWIAISEIDAYRNYRRFSKLASVRGESENKPRGLPKDISETAKFHSDFMGIDGHSHSYMDAYEALNIFHETEENKPQWFREPCDGFDYYFNFSNEDIGNLDKRIVFWFDN